MKKKLSPAIFIETEPRRHVDKDGYYKSFDLRMELINFTCSPETKFEDVKDQMIRLAKEYLDNAQLMSQEEYTKIMQQMYSREFKKLSDDL